MTKIIWRGDTMYDLDVPEYWHRDQAKILFVRRTFEHYDARDFGYEVSRRDAKASYKTFCIEQPRQFFLDREEAKRYAQTMYLLTRNQGESK